MKRPAKRSKEKTRELKKKLGYVPYDILPILSTDSHYNVIWGERSNGKTYGALEIAIEEYWKNGRKRSVYLRRWDMDIKGKKGEEVLSGVASSGIISEITGGVYTTVLYRNRKGYLARYDEDLMQYVKDEDPFIYFYALNTSGHDKGAFIPDLKYIFFDEFIEPVGNYGYLEDEFTIFKNAISTFVRYRDDVKIFLLGNTVNNFNPYFKWFNFTHARQQKQGTIERYESEKKGLVTKYAVEYSESSANKNGGKGKPSDVYFTMEKSSMITNGVWELKEYPILPVRFKKDDIVFTYFISYNEYIMQCEIILHNDSMFTYIHKKTTPIQNENYDLIYTPEFHYEKNYCRNIFVSKTEIERKITWFYLHDKVFYQDNEIGSVVDNYLQECNKMS